MKVDWPKIEASKRKLRARLAALPFAEKLRILEQLRERHLALRDKPVAADRNAPRRSKGRSPA